MKKLSKAKVNYRKHERTMLARQQRQEEAYFCRETQKSAARAFCDWCQEDLGPEGYHLNSTNQCQRIPESAPLV